MHRIKLTAQAGKTFLVLAICLALAGIAASTAGAADDVTISPFHCQNHGGSATVPAGSTITVQQGFAEQTLGIMTVFLNAQTNTVSLNGTTVDVSDAFSAPVQTPDGGWLTLFTYPTGITLAAPGDTLTINWTTTLAHVVPDIFNPAAGGPAGKPLFGQGSTTITCTVTAV